MRLDASRQSGPGDPEPAQRAQPSVREAGGVATDRVALDDDARDAAAHDHDVG